MRIAALVLLTIFVSFSSFAQRTAVTQDKILEWTALGAVEELQWYISDAIEIRREVQVTENLDIKSLLEKGKMNIVGGKYFEIDLFSKSARGNLEYMENNEIAVRLRTDEGRFLVFELTEKSKLESVAYFKLKITERDKKKWVHYGGHEWLLMSGSHVILEVKGAGSTKARVQKTKIKGLNKDGSERKTILQKLKKNN